MTTELLQEFEPQIEAITLVPEAGGKFELSLNDTLVFSKLQLQRHAEPGEVIDLVKKYIQENQ